MSHKKNLSAKDLSEKFGFDVTEGDLNPAFDKDSKYLNQMADLSEFAAELDKTLPAEQKAATPETEEPEPEAEKNFAELFEEKNKLVDTEKPAPEKKPAVKKNKLVELNDDMDFGKLFKASSMKVFDKDAVAMPDKDYEPFEMNEDDVKAAGKTEFHGFEDFANAFGGGKKHKK